MNSNMKELSLHYNPSLECEFKLEEGKLVSNGYGYIDLKKISKSPTGCGGTFTFKHKNDNKPLYSIARFHTAYIGSNCFEWLRNDLNLHFTIKDGDDYGRLPENTSHPLIHVNFRD